VRGPESPRSAARAATAPFHVRAMTPHDVRAVVALERKVFSDPWPETLFREALRETSLTTALVVEDAGTVAGYALCTFVSDEAHLENLAVQPERRGMGMAQALLAALLDLAADRACSYMALEVRAANARAIRFYERNGFQSVAIRKNYYRRPVEDAIVMLLSLKMRETRDA
jgi:ribosomal-protein-alanine N-acetyltransferase